MYHIIANQITDVSEDEAYQHLAKSIVIQAIEDYRKVLHNIKIDRYRQIKSDKAEIEHFFRSDWCYILSNWDGETLMNLIKQQEGITDERTN